MTTLQQEQNAQGKRVSSRVRKKLEGFETTDTTRKTEIANDTAAVENEPLSPSQQVIFPTQYTTLCHFQPCLFPYVQQNISQICIFRLV